MGAKTTILAFTTSDGPPALTPGPTPVAAAETLLTAVFPGHVVTPLGTTTDLWDAVFPPEDVTYAAVFPSAAVVCDHRVAGFSPSALPPDVLAATTHRRVVMHAMHSVVDWLCFAVWEDGVLRRALSVAPDDGVIEDVGARLPFEEPYWAGHHPLEPFDDEDDGYPLPFHPLELGEEALRALFGFVVEGTPGPADIDPEAVVLHGFRVTSHAGARHPSRTASAPGPFGRLVASVRRALRP